MDIKGVNGPPITNVKFNGTRNDILVLSLSIQANIGSEDFTLYCISFSGIVFFFLNSWRMCIINVLQLFTFRHGRNIGRVMLLSTIRLRGFRWNSCFKVQWVKKVVFEIMSVCHLCCIEQSNLETHLIWFSDATVKGSCYKNKTKKCRYSCQGCFLSFFFYYSWTVLYFTHDCGLLMNEWLEPFLKNCIFYKSITADLSLIYLQLANRNFWRGPIRFLRILKALSPSRKFYQNRCNWFRENLNFS